MPNVLFMENSDYWSVQMGTTIEAVSAGSGELGQKYKDNIKGYLDVYEAKQPVISEDGVVSNYQDKPYYIVHQYDRTPGLKEIIQKAYDDK